MRRRTLFKILCVVAVAGFAVLPLLSILALKQAENEQRRHTADTIASATLLHAENIFADAESALRKLGHLTDARSGDNSIQALRAFVFAQKYIRGIGIIQDGRLVATNAARMNPPRKLRPGSAGDFPGGRLSILPPVGVMGGGKSILAVWPVRNRAALCAAINPALFDDVVWTMADRDHVHLVVRIPRGARLAEFGAPAPPKPAIKARVDSKRFPLVVEASTSRVELSHTLQRHGWFAAAPGLLLDAVLLGILIYFSRRVSSLESDLREASGFGEVRAEYQPQCDLATGACVGVEILMRWNHPARGAISPDVFIPAAEKLGLVRSLTLALARRVVDELGPWIARHPGVHVSINLGAEHCGSEEAAREVAEILGAAVPAAQQVYELTERGLVTRAEAPGLVWLESLADQGGAALALDDFGTGFSSLGCLNQFKFQYLKIDKSFVDGIRDENTCDGTLDQVINLAQSLGMKLIAEGVEHEWQAAYLRSRGVTIGQGWRYSRPLGGAEFRRFVETRAVG